MFPIRIFFVKALFFRTNFKSKRNIFYALFAHIQFYPNVNFFNLSYPKKIEYNYKLFIIVTNII